MASERSNGGRRPARVWMPLALPVYGSNPTQEATRGSGQVRHHRRGGCNVVAMQVYDTVR